MQLKQGPQKFEKQTPFLIKHHKMPPLPMRSVFQLFVISLFCAVTGCTRSLAPESHWPEELRGKALSHVLVRKDLGLFSKGLGSGLILHSSKEEGTIVLTCGHVAAYHPDMLLEGSINDFYTPSGKEYIVDQEGELDVFLHKNVIRGDAPWSEWQKFGGEVLYGKYVINEFLIDSKYRASSITELKSHQIFDVALIRIRTGREPLHSIPLISGIPTFPTKGFVSGIDYNSNQPYRREVLIPSERIFFKDGQYSSGSGVFDQDKRFLGVYSMRFGVKGTMKTGEERFKVSMQHCYTPFRRIRESLEKEGFAWVFSR